MLELKKSLKDEYIDAHLGKTLSFLPEDFKDGYTEGYTENYLKIYLPMKIEGEIVKVKPIKKYKDGAIAELL